MTMHFLTLKCLAYSAQLICNERTLRTNTILYIDLFLIILDSKKNQYIENTEHRRHY